MATPKEAVKQLSFTINFVTSLWGPDQIIQIESGQELVLGRCGDESTVLISNQAIRFNSKVISRKHAFFQFVDNKLFLKDTKSSSGTFLNNKRLSPPGAESGLIELNDSDLLTFGQDCPGPDGTIYKAVSFRVLLDRTESRPVIASSVSDVLLDNYASNYRPSVNNPDIELEFDAIWESIHHGLDSGIRKYLNLAIPASNKLENLGVFDSITEGISKTEARKLTMNYKIVKAPTVNDKNSVETDLNGPVIQTLISEQKSIFG